MTPLHLQFVTDDQQQRQAVVIPLNEWEHVVEELEELDDIRAYDAAKAESPESLPFDQAVREIGEGFGA